MRARSLVLPPCATAHALLLRVHCVAVSSITFDGSGDHIAVGDSLGMIEMYQRTGGVRAPPRT